MPATLYITMDACDNVAIVVNDGGLPAATVFASGLRLVEKVPRAHKAALADIAEGGEVRRYNVVIGYALKPIAAGSWVHERLLRMPAAHGHHPDRAVRGRRDRLREHWKLHNALVLFNPAPVT